MKAGPDPLMKSQNFSDFVDRPEELWNIQLPKPKYADTPYAPIIENCVETMCVPVSNNINFSSPSQRIGSNYSPLCEPILINFSRKNISINPEKTKNYNLYADTRTN